MLHVGDSDSTGTIAASWFGAYQGFKGVPGMSLDVEILFCVRSITLPNFPLPTK